MKKAKKSFWYKNGLVLAFLALTLFSLSLQIYTGLIQYNNFLEDHHIAQVSLSSYMISGHFLQATFENWESEFLQMGLFVWFTVFLKQKGSSESKKIDGEEPVDRPPMKHKNAPWPVKKGGWILKLYEHSLSLALFALFFISFILHWIGSHQDFNERQLLEGKPGQSFILYLANSRFWFESFQNWQSEFLSVCAIVFLSIYLREIGSPQSKPVDAPYSQTGE